MDRTYAYYNKMFSGTDSWIVWIPYLTLKTESRRSIADVELALLDTHPSKELNIRRADDLEWTIDTTSKAQTESFMKLKTICNTPVKASPHNNLNYKYGTMAIPQREEINIAEDKENLYP